MYPPWEGLKKHESYYTHYVVLNTFVGRGRGEEFGGGVGVIIGPPYLFLRQRGGDCAYTKHMK